MTVIETKVIALVCIRSTTVGTTFHKCGIVATVEVKLGEFDNTNIAALKRLELGGFACNQLRRRYNARVWIVIAVGSLRSRSSDGSAATLPP